MRGAGKTTIALSVIISFNKLLNRQLNHLVGHTLMWMMKLKNTLMNNTKLIQLKWQLKIEDGNFLEKLKKSFFLK